MSIVVSLLLHHWIGIKYAILHMTHGGHSYFRKWFNTVRDLMNQNHIWIKVNILMSVITYGEASVFQSVNLFLLRVKCRKYHIERKNTKTTLCQTKFFFSKPLKIIEIMTECLHCLVMYLNFFLRWREKKEKVVFFKCLNGHKTRFPLKLKGAFIVATLQVFPHSNWRHACVRRTLSLSRTHFDKFNRRLIYII